MNTIKNIFRFFFGFKGRIGRLHYSVFLLSFTAMYFFFPFSLTRPIRMSSYNLIHSLSSPVVYTPDIISSAIAFSLILIITTIFLLIKYSHITRRIHDYNKKVSNSSLYSIILLLDIISLPIMLIISPIYIIVFSISIICMISLAFIKGDDEENNFGKPQILFWKKTNS